MKGTRKFHKDPGMARSGIGFLVLLLYANTRPGHGPCLAETVRSRSRERVPGLVWECLAGSGRHSETYTVLVEKLNKAKIEKKY